MKKLIFAGLLALFLMPGEAQARVSESIETFESGYSSYTVVGVHCASGTITNVLANTLMSGFRIGGYRVQNPSSNDVWVGGETMATGTPSGAGNFDYAIVLKQYAMVPIPVGKHKNGSTFTAFYCRAENAATSGQYIAVEVFGYK